MLILHVKKMRLKEIGRFSHCHLIVSGILFLGLDVMAFSMKWHKAIGITYCLERELNSQGILTG